MDKYDDIISRQLQMFELSKRIEAKSEGQWTQFQRDTVPFILWKISESEGGMSYPEVLSCLEQYGALDPSSLRDEVNVLLSLVDCENYGVLDGPDGDYEDDHNKWIWIGEDNKGND